MYNKGIQLHTSARRNRPSGYGTTGSLYKGNIGEFFSDLSPTYESFIIDPHLEHCNPFPGQKLQTVTKGRSLFFVFGKATPLNYGPHFKRALLFGLTNTACQGSRGGFI